MSGDVITLDGLESAKLSGTPESCGRLVTINSPVLGQEVRVCESDVKRIAGGLDQTYPKRKRGRPKGSTVMAGAKRPKLKKCISTKIFVTKRGRKICKCTDKGNKQILPNNRCDL